MDKIFAPFLPPWAETGLQPAFYDVESGTVLQQTARMYDKVNQLIRLFNEFSEATSEEVNAFEREVNETVEEYIEKFTELKDYVEDYFENLDVQEEINNKLDDMAEDGTLADIIADYLKLKGVLAYTNVQDLKEAENIVAGSMCETYGWYTQGDGGSAKYRIRTITNDDTIDDATIISITADPTNTLIAELIPQDEMNVKQFGVKGDGTTDDTDRLQIALTFCSGKVLHFGKFTTGISEPLSANNLIIEGDNVTIKALTGFSGSSMFEPHNKISIKNAKFDANSEAICCVGESDDNTYMDIEGCDFTGAKRNVREADNFALNSCVYLTGQNNTMTNTKVHDNLSHGCRIMSKVAHSTVNIDNCQFINNGSREEGTEVVAIGLVQYGGENGILYDKVSISNCYASGNANTGIAPHSCNNLTITNCTSNYNNEHGFCVMDGKNCTISNCIAIDNARYGVRIQGDYTVSNIYRGYKNCVVTGCYIQGSGFDIDENIDGVLMTGNTFVKSDASLVGDLPRGGQLGRTSYPSSKLSSINVTNNVFLGYETNKEIYSSIMPDNKCNFKNLVNGKTVDYIRRSSYCFLNTASNIKYGVTDNILTNGGDPSQWTLVAGATLNNNVITKGTDDFVAYQRANLDTCPKYLSVLLDCASHSVGDTVAVGFRFRDSSNTIIGSSFSSGNIVLNDNKLCCIFDIAGNLGTLVPANVAKVDINLYLIGNTSSLAVNGMYCALSDEPPVLANTLV